jgi:3-hydroxyisobutyrate dehydrogenase-like beta-hydroxyacid dehydrogenase
MPKTLGFVGLGNMGGNMAARFMAAGYTVYGESRTKAHAQHLIDAGLQWCDTPREIAESTDVVFTSLPDDDSLKDASESLLAGLSAGKVWVDVSTVSPSVSRELAAKARERGAAMLDAPVSGSAPQVHSGTLTIMVGGTEDAYREIEPLLRVLGTPTRVGDNGHGLALKLAVNISLAVQMLAFSEGLLLAERDGVDKKLAADVITSSQLGSPMLKLREPLVLDLPAEAWFSVRLMQKDIRLAEALAEELGVPAPTAAVADKWLSRAGDLGYENRDIAALYRALAESEPL